MSAKTAQTDEEAQVKAGSDLANIWLNQGRATSC